MEAEAQEPLGTYPAPWWRPGSYQATGPVLIDVLGEKWGSTRVTQVVEIEALMLVLGPETRPLRHGSVVMMAAVVVAHRLAHASRENEAKVFPSGSP